MEEQRNVTSITKRAAESKDMALIILSIIELIITKGIPAYMEWSDGMKIENPSLADIEALMNIKKPEDF